MDNDESRELNDSGLFHHSIEQLLTWSESDDRQRVGTHQGQGLGATSKLAEPDQQ